MKSLIKYPAQSTWESILQRPTQSVEAVESIVNEVFLAVKQEGDLAIKRYTKQFDQAELKSVFVSQKEIDSASEVVSKDLKEAIQQAKSNIEVFHNAQKTTKVDVETQPGVRCWQEKRPIETVGLYIPGGTAPLFSTVLMLAVPATLAGCKNIVLCSPPNAEGVIANEILYTAGLCGITTIIKVGGIQAIAGLTFGTASIPKVSKIFGPGNQYVTVAKQLATKFGVAIDMPAGPSELLIVADKNANPAFIASDLLSQAEHGVDSQVVLVSTDEKLLLETAEQIRIQTQLLDRKSIIEKALENKKLILVISDQEAVDLINYYGPEHYIICTENNSFFVDNVINAGSVFIGEYTPESAGDYASGTNHTLPTNGYAKAYSGVNLDSFLKNITFQEITKQGLATIGTTIELMAEAEGLMAHKNAVSIRLKSIEDESK
ncbi:histidinol dehydrogenase [Flavobacteriaceae bacterium]|nr:histidinol dehydrogenase [Flavobacteriaceae bacterium]MDA7724256.1 histidinol dehydrogenase [Flavobacteriaceae bacterium]MDA7728236.1 histidinol dehydrogenase [Flavobacteriaceae bacterium]